MITSGVGSMAPVDLAIATILVLQSHSPCGATHENSPLENYYSNAVISASSLRACLGFRLLELKAQFILVLYYVGHLWATCKASIEAPSL
jgi:hypothetical protein